MKKKYKTQVAISTTVSKIIGEVEFDTKEEFLDKAYEMWEAQDNDSPSNYACNDYDMGDWDIDPIDNVDLKYCENKNEG